MNTETYRSQIERGKGQRSILSTQLKTAKRALRNSQRDLENGDKALIIIQEVAQKTLKELEYRIGEVVSLALSAVFDDPYRLVLVSSIKHGKTAFSLFFERDGEMVRPYDSSGGGAVDVAAFALRISLWSLKSPGTRNTVILDEPFRFISADLQDKAGLMLKEISKRLNLQIIMVSHNESLIDISDKSFNVTMKKGKSIVREI